MNLRNVIVLSQGVCFMVDSTLMWMVPWLALGLSNPAHGVHPDEMYAARRWVAARFQGVEEALPHEAALVVEANHGPVQQNGRGNKKLRIESVPFARGLYCHAESRLAVRLPGPATKFSAVIGVDSNEQTRGGRGSVVFSVRVGDQEVFCSELMREGMAGVPVQVELRGSREFELRVDNGGDGISCDQADWADARIMLADGQVVWLDDLLLVDDSAAPMTYEPPFSFSYGGVSSASFLSNWRLHRTSRALDDARIEHRVTYTDTETGLVACCVAVEYRDFPTVEWVLYLENTGSVDTPVLADIQPLDVTWRRGPGSEFTLHHQRGDSCSPDSYEPLVKVLDPNSQERFAPVGGRPTNGAWPYWNIQWARGGVLTALGWPGTMGGQFRA